MVLNDYGKLIILLTVLVGAIVLLAFNRIDETAGLTTIGTIVGYVTGNGRVALTGKAPSPMIVSTDPTVTQ